MTSLEKKIIKSMSKNKTYKMTDITLRQKYVYRNDYQAAVISLANQGHLIRFWDDEGEVYYKKA